MGEIGKDTLSATAAAASRKRRGGKGARQTVLAEPLQRGAATGDPKLDGKVGHGGDIVCALLLEQSTSYLAVEAEAIK